MTTLTKMQNACDEDRNRLHLAHVANRNCVHKLLAYARIGEQVFHDDDPADQVLDVLAEDLDGWSKSVAQRVAPHDPPMGQSI